MLRSRAAGLTSCWQRETLLFHPPELCLSSRGWEGLTRDKVWAWFLCQEIEAIPVASSDSGAQGDNKEWHPTCANSPAVSLLQCSHPADIIAQGRHMLQCLCLANLSNDLLLQNLVWARTLYHKPLPAVRVACWNFALGHKIHYCRSLQGCVWIKWTRQPFKQERGGETPVLRVIWLVDS